MHTNESVLPFVFIRGQSCLGPAGITHFGTEGAGEFLSDPAHFAEAVPRLPPDWQARNLQIELPATGACSQHTSGKNNLGHVLCFPFVFIRISFNL